MTRVTWYQKALPAELVGYVHKVSPTKRSRQNNEYFNFSLQAKSGEQPCLCFSPAKRNIFVEREKNKTAIKLQRFNMSKDGKTIFINDMTKVVTPSSFEYDFQFTDITAKNLNLKTMLETCTNMDIVDFVAKVIYKDAAIQEVGSSRLKKSECIIADESSEAVKLILWQGDIDKVSVGEVYAFGNIRFRDGNGYGTKTFNTTKDTIIEKQASHYLIDHSPDILSEMPASEYSTNRSLNVRFIHSIEELVKYKECGDCKRKIQQDTAKTVVKCDFCGHVVRSASCRFNMYCKFSVINNDVTSPSTKETTERTVVNATGAATNSEENLVRFVMFKDVIKKLIGEVEHVDDDDLCEKLMLAENFKIIFGKDNVVTSVETSK